MMYRSILRRKTGLEPAIDLKKGKDKIMINNVCCLKLDHLISSKLSMTVDTTWLKIHTYNVHLLILIIDLVMMGILGLKSISGFAHFSQVNTGITWSGLLSSSFLLFFLKIKL